MSGTYCPHCGSEVEVEITGPRTVTVRSQEGPKEEPTADSDFNVSCICPNCRYEYRDYSLKAFQKEQH